MTAVLDLHPDPGHPAAVISGVHEALDGWEAAVGVRADELAALVGECARARTRLKALELALVAAADQAAVATAAGARSTGAWLASTTRSDGAQAARDTRLAVDLDTRLATTAAALADGAVSAEHAMVIADAMRSLPAGLSPHQRDQVETRLNRDALQVDPATLRRRGRRALAAVEADPTLVDAHEDRLVEDEERRALARVRITLHDNGDGTTSGHFIVPMLAGSILRKVLDAMTSPRRGRPGATSAQAGPALRDRDPAHERGAAFTQLLEHLPTDHLHGKVAATVVVTLDHATLLGRLKAAGLDTGDLVSASQARRLACQAGILPAVLGGASQVLDLGRSHRFFSQTQRVAGATTHTACAAEGCDVPYAWCDLHHRVPWSHGGSTDLADLVPLCGFHHRRIHDQGFESRIGSDRTITFHRRT